MNDIKIEQEKISNMLNEIEVSIRILRKQVEEMNEIIEEQKSPVYNLSRNNDIQSTNIKCSKKKTIELLKKERLCTLL